MSNFLHVLLANLCLSDCSPKIPPPQKSLLSFPGYWLFISLWKLSESGLGKWDKTETHLHTVWPNIRQQIPPQIMVCVSLCVCTCICVSTHVPCTLLKGQETTSTVNISAFIFHNVWDRVSWLFFYCVSQVYWCISFQGFFFLQHPTPSRNTGVIWSYTLWLNMDSENSNSYFQTYMANAFTHWDVPCPIFSISPLRRKGFSNWVDE